MKFKKIILGLILSLTLTTSVFAVTARREITGTVTDQNNKFVGALKVKLINGETKKTYQTKTNKSGYYSFKNLPFGIYTLKFEGKKEYKPKITGKLELGLNGGLMYNVILESK